MVYYPKYGEHRGPWTFAADLSGHPGACRATRFLDGEWQRRLLAGPGDVRSKAPALEGASRPRWTAQAEATSLIDTLGPLNLPSGQRPPGIMVVQPHAINVPFVPEG